MENGYVEIKVRMKLAPSDEYAEARALFESAKQELAAVSDITEDEAVEIVTKGLLNLLQNGADTNFDLESVQVLDRHGNWDELMGEQ